MKLTILQENLKRGLAIVSHAVAGKSTLPVLANVLLAIDGSRLKLAATNLEVGITHWIGAQVQEAGGVTVPARLLADVVGGLPNDTVTLTLNERTQTLKVECGPFTSNLKGIEADEFPSIPAPLADPSAVLPADLLTSCIDQVAFAAADDDARPVLAGVLVRITGSELVMAAADGFRLAFRRAALPTPARQKVECIMPARALGFLARIAGASEEIVRVTLAPGGSQVRFHTDTTELTSRLIDGKFPDVERIIPTTAATRAVMDVAELRKATKLAAYFATASQNVVKLDLQPGGELGSSLLTLSANAAEVGDNTGTLDGMITGERGQIALNVKYLEEGLAALGTAQVAVEINTPSSPGVLKPVGHEGYVYVIMPMSLR